MKDLKILMTGHKSLLRKLRKIPVEVQIKGSRKALRPHAVRIKEIAEAAIPIDEGDLRFAGLKVRALSKRARKRGLVGYRVVTPTRKELNIPADAKGYYPAHLELGHGNVRPRPYLRGTVASQREATQAGMAVDMRNFILTAASK